MLNIIPIALGRMIQDLHEKTGPDFRSVRSVFTCQYMAKTRARFMCDMRSRSRIDPNF